MEQVPMRGGTPSQNRVVPIIVASVLVSALIAGGGVYAYQKSETTKTQGDLQAQIDDLKSDLADARQVVATPTPSATPAGETINWKTYTSDAVQSYSIQYPGNLIAEYTESTHTLAINDPSKTKPNAVLTINAGDAASMTLDQFIASLKKDMVVSGERKTTLAGKTAYEGVDQGIINQYGLYAVANDVTYTLRFPTSNKDTLADLKGGLSSTQKLMIDSFNFTK